ncbi:hypothetical protein DEO72_LG8g815 [Vigna unguiculata]|uniref:C2 domain-containing protein n=1 Tax=Vigna unguiculata TaxID=3917 RepID=A0A4D6MMM0_VIGUN|nr:hypothetical protein DEO72_LG8g815 [Vigna unguiculata]
MEANQKNRTLEITVVSGENIRVDRNSVSEVYVVVRAESLNCCTTKMVNGNDDGVHAWNEKLLLEVPSYARSVTFEVQCKKYKEVRPVGVARIALSDLVSAENNGVLSESVAQSFCYGLRDWDGRRNGVIHFSVKMVDNLCSETEQEKDVKMVNCRGIEKEVLGFRKNPNKSNRVVIGIPVNWFTKLLKVEG